VGGAAEDLMRIYEDGPETLRLTHRAFTAADAEALFALNSNPEVMRYTGEPRAESVEAMRTAIADYPDFNTVGFGRWACVLNETERIIGFCGLKHLSDIGEVDIGFRFLPEFWGRGLATEAAGACLEFGFETIGLSRIVGLVLPDNLASVRVLEKIGMDPDGEMQLDGERVLRFATTRSGS
jgi:ribosomal-protein-alanine N-acetyltransferase